MLENYFISAMPDNAMQGQYTAYLVILSYIVATFGSYTGLSLASEYSTTSQRGLKRALLAGGALAMGCGIWSMHYIGMIAYKMSMPMHHDPLLTGISMAIAVLIAVGFFRIVAMGQLKARNWLAATLLLGAAICGMHYIGMAGMEMQLMHTRYLPEYFAASVAIAIAASGAAIWLFFRVEVQPTPARKSALRGVASLAMGAAICGMHYMGMKAAVFVPEDGMCVSPIGFGLADTNGQALAVAGVTGVILGIALFLRLFKKATSFFAGNAEANSFPIRIMVLSLAAKMILVVLLAREYYSLHAAAHDVLAEASQLSPAARTGGVQTLLGHIQSHYESSYAMMILLLGLPLVIVIWGFTVASLRRWQRDLIEARAEAMKANSAKSEFLANMSHDLRTPMNGIIGLTRLLSEGRLYPEQEELVSAVMKSSDSLLLLLNDILDFSKMEAGQLTLEEAPCFLKGALQDIVNLLSPLASKKGVAINFNYCEMSPPCVVGDTTRIGQVVTNLLGNAIKFTDAGSVTLGVTAIPAAESGAYIYEIRVEDTGIGISPEVQKNLFRKFSQGDASINRKFGGTGLGLAITRMLVEKMQGEITLESEPGRGTTVRATMVLRSATARQVKARYEMQHAPMTQVASRTFQGGRVLLVDDHPVNRLFALRLLEKMGFKDVAVAQDGSEALAMASAGEKPYDIILMDCQMPGMDGMEATRRIRNHETKTGTAPTPIIAVTAHAMASDRDNCLQAGMDDYISKPINPNSLFAALQKHLPGAQQAAFSPCAPAAAPVAAPETAHAAPVDLEHLALFTDGDAGQERLMAEVFLSSGAEILESLRALAAGGAGDDWKKAAHKLKGSAGQIGAASLASACLAAELGNAAPDIEKQSMLQSIEKHFSDVQLFFSARLSLAH